MVNQFDNPAFSGVKLAMMEKVRKRGRVRERERARESKRERERARESEREQERARESERESVRRVIREIQRRAAAEYIHEKVLSKIGLL